MASVGPLQAFSVLREPVKQLNDCGGVFLVSRQILHKLVALFLRGLILCGAGGGGFLALRGMKKLAQLFSGGIHALAAEIGVFHLLASGIDVSGA
ncbi:hypothetical protein D3C71_1994120 [compost metagenome]